MSDLKPKLRTKTVYEKVDLHINEIAKRMIDGEVFYNHDGSDKFDWKLNGFSKNGLALTGLNGFDFYCRVEKEIDWRDEVHNKLQSDYHWSTPIAEIINDESDCFLELCRVALRATGELE